MRGRGARRNLTDRQTGRPPLARPLADGDHARTLVDPPIWFNEGTAEFWGTARQYRGSVQGGQVRKDHLATLARSKAALPKLQQFVHGTRGDFYANAHLRYAQAWALVHFLRKGSPFNQRLFGRLQAQLRTDKPLAAAVDAAFDGVDWQKFETDFQAYVRSLQD